MFNKNIMFLVLCYISLSNAHERITLFQSDITIQSHGMIIVQETIEVISEHKEILHGIVRKFPTKYRDTFGSFHYASFRLASITHNQQAATYSIKNNYDSCTIYIGDRKTVIPKGKHRYTIMYEMDCRLSFFDNYAEFYWNVTGDQWRLPIEVVQATINLPDNDNKNLITTKIFTTYHGMHRNNDYNTVQNKAIIIKPFYLLRPHESLTILITFPKGYFIESNLHKNIPQPLNTDILSLLIIVILLCYFIMLSILLIFIWFKNRPNNITPQVYPPENMTPSEVGFIINKSFSSKLLIADIIDMMYLKFITITCTNSQYKIALQKTINLDCNFTLDQYYQKLVTTLFKKK